MLDWLRNRALMAVTLGHFSVDMYSGMLPLILVTLTRPLNLSYAQVADVSLAFALASSLTQPYFGWLADRVGGRWLAAGGVALIAIMMGLMRLTTTYPPLLALAAVAGIGSAAFHPQGAANAAMASGKRKATGISIFMLGGNSGFATGPVVARFAFATAGQGAIGLLTGFGLLLSALQVWAAPRRIKAADAPAVEAKSGTAGLNDYNPMARYSAVALIVVIFLRQWVHSSMTTYLPQWVVAQGYSVDVASNLSFALLLPLALGGLLGGSLADRVGRKPIILTSLLGAIPLVLLLLNSPLTLQFFIAPVLGMLIGASFPITLVMAQELLPRGIGVMSGLALGFTFIAGSIGVAITGRLADALGLQATLSGLALVALVGVCAALLLPRRDRRTAEAPITQTADANPSA